MKLTRELSTPSSCQAACQRSSNGRPKNDALIHRQAQPGVIEHFALELTGFPAGIAERHEGVQGTCAAGDGREHVA